MNRAQRHDLTGIAWSVTTGMALLGATALALGRPDTSGAGDFLTTGRPTRDDALATVELVVWAIVVLVLVAQVIYAMRGAAEATIRIRRRHARARAAVLLGLVILGGGALRHAASGAGSLCCADITRAERLVR